MKTLLHTSLITLLLFSACSQSETVSAPYLEPQLSTEEEKELVNRIENLEAKLAAQESLDAKKNTGTTAEETPEDSTDTPETEEITEPSESQESFITLQSPSEGEQIAKPADQAISFTGKLSLDTTNLKVTAKGEDYTDVYELQNYTPGEDGFTYRARQDWGNLAPGQNTYTFLATFEDGSTKEDSVTITYSES